MQTLGEKDIPTGHEDVAMTSPRVCVREGKTSAVAFYHSVGVPAATYRLVHRRRQQLRAFMYLNLCTVISCPSHQELFMIYSLHFLSHEASQYRRLSCKIVCSIDQALLLPITEPQVLNRVASTPLP